MLIMFATVIGLVYSLCYHTRGKLKKKKKKKKKKKRRRREKRRMCR